MPGTAGDHRCELTCLFTVGRAAYGVALLCAPARVAGLAAGAPPNSTIRLAGRVLGARQVAQAVVTAARPGPSTLRFGAATDAAHCASMVALAADCRKRRGALTDASVALALAVAGMLLAGACDDR